MATQNKWFKIKSPLKTKDIVEYSTDFKFFSENQIRIVRTGRRYNLCSRLEAKSFKNVDSFLKSGDFSDTELMHKVREVHQEVLSGKHGEGVLVD